MAPDPSIRRLSARPAGYTLVELLLVVLILGLLAMAAIPSAGLADDQKLDALQLQIQDAIQFARNMAYQKGAPHAVLFGDYPFYNSAAAWFAVVNELGVPVKEPLTRNDYVTRLQSMDLPAGLLIEAVNFNPRPMAVFDEKGVLFQPGEIHIATRSSKRWLVLDSATLTLTEIEVAP